MRAAFFFGVLSMSLCGQCASRETAPPTPAGAATSLRQLAPFPMGAAVDVTLLQTRTAYQQVVTREYNSVTAENAMKFASLHPTATTYTWADADYLVAFARQHQARVHGHTLVWHRALPTWVTAFQGDSAAWENLLRTHIQTVVAHFKGQVQSWDVVNEALDDTGQLRNSLWRQHLGDDYVARAFQYAHAADPAALLFYNDYGHEYSPAKRTAFLQLVTRLQKRGIPLDGLGLQLHTNSNTSDANIANAIATAGATGLKVHVSELDISMNPSASPTATFTPALAAAQQVKYQALVQAYRALPAAQRYGITTWNVADADTWRRSDCGCPDWPLPFDDNYAPKPAYAGIVAALQ